MDKYLIASELTKVARDLVSYGVLTRLNDGMDAAFDIVDGIDGMMSETGSFPSRYWKKDVLRRYDKLADIINKGVRFQKIENYQAVEKQVKDLLEDLIDGLEGVISETGRLRYWNRSALTNANKMLRKF